nr:immunoglobulin heavy chain junction region [Mus musculus]
CSRRGWLLPFDYW